MGDKAWYEFNYHNGNKVTLHSCTEDFVDRVRKVATAREWDVVITKMSDRTVY